MFNGETKRASLWEEIQRHNCTSVGNRDELVRLPTAGAIRPDQKLDTVTAGDTLLVRRVCVRVLGGLRERDKSVLFGCRGSKDLHARSLDRPTVLRQGSAVALM